MEIEELWTCNMSRARPW